MNSDPLPSLQFDSLHDAMVALQTDLESYQASVRRWVEFTTESFVDAERRECELRDDLHAVANRVESLTQVAAPFFTTAEAAAIRACNPDESGGVRDDAA